MIISILSKGMGFLRDVNLSYVWGATEVSDSFVISMTIPGTVCDLLVQAITIGYIPIYTKTRIDKNIEQANGFTTGFIEFLLICCIPISLAIVFFPELIIKIFASGFDAKTTALSSTFIKITIFSIFSKMIVCVLIGFLNSNSKYLLPAFIGIPYDVVIILGIVLSKTVSTTIIPVCILLAGIVQAFILIVASQKIGLVFKFTKRIINNEIKDVIKLLIPLLIIVSVNQLNTIIDRSFASYVQIGAVTILDYANKISLMIENVVVYSIIAILYPKLGESSARKDKKGFTDSILESSNKIILYLLPISVILFFLSKIIFSFLFERGQFSSSNVIDSAQCMSFYAIGVCFVALRTIYIRALYAIGEVKYVTITSIIVLAFNVLFNFILSHLLGLKGLALATSLCSVLATGFLAYELWKYSHTFKLFSLKSFLFSAAISLILFLAIVIVNIISRHFALSGKIYDFIVLAFIGLLYCALIFISDRHISRNNTIQ